MITLKCPCGAVLYRDKSRYPGYSVIGCPKCKRVSKISKPSSTSERPWVEMPASPESPGESVLFKTDGA